MMRLSEVGALVQGPRAGLGPRHSVHPHTHLSLFPGKGVLSCLWPPLPLLSTAKEASEGAGMEGDMSGGCAGVGISEDTTQQRTGAEQGSRDFSSLVWGGWENDL